MEVLVYLIPASLFLGALGLAGFFWTLRSRQYDDPEGDKRRILSSEWDDRPKPEPPATPARSRQASKRN